MSLDELAKEIMAKQRKSRHEKHLGVWSPSMTPVTDLGHRCIRRNCYHQIFPEQAKQINEELASIFEEGKLHEKDVRRELSELGFEVVESETNFKDLDLQVTGTIDGKIQYPKLGARKGYGRAPCEIKGLAGGIPRSFEDWLRSDSELLRRYLAQIDMYLFLTNEPEGLELFKDKMTGLWTIIPVELSLERGEVLFQRAEEIRDAVAVVKGGINQEQKLELLPERIPNRSECGKCPWYDECLPGDAAVDPLLLAKDGKLFEQLVDREAKQPIAREFKKLDDKIKDRFKHTKGDRFVVGDKNGFMVTKRPHGKGVRIDIKRLEFDSVK